MKVRRFTISMLGMGVLSGQAFGWSGCPHPLVEALEEPGRNLIAAVNDATAYLNANKMTPDQVVDAFIQRARAEKSRNATIVEHVKLQVQHDGQTAVGSATRTIFPNGMITWTKPVWPQGTPHWATFPIDQLISHDNGTPGPEVDRENYEFKFKEKKLNSQGLADAFVFSISPTTTALQKLDNSKLVQEELVVDAKTFDKLGDHEGRPMKDPSPTVKNPKYDRTFVIQDGVRVDNHMISTFTADLSTLNILKRAGAEAFHGGGDYRIDCYYDNIQITKNNK